MFLLIAALVLYAAALISTCAYALIKGGRDERAGAVIVIGAVIASQFAARLGTHWHTPEYGVLTVDTLVLLALVTIACRSTRFWPLWAAAAQLVGTLTHLAIILQPSITMEAYAATQPFWAFPVLGAIAIGTLGHQRTRRK